MVLNLPQNTRDSSSLWLPRFFEVSTLHPFTPLLLYSLRFEMRLFGEVPEWLNGLAWKACVHASVPRVRIPPSPPVYDFERLTVFSEPFSCLRLAAPLGLEKQACLAAPLEYWGSDERQWI
jgi:hypothetical protein